jgi:Holliday junction resolvase RusA-like endonuclease
MLHLGANMDKEGGEMMIKLTIPGAPCAKGRPRLGKYGTYTPQKTINAETLIKELYILGNYGKQLEGALEMTVKACFPIPKSKSNKVAVDMSMGKIRPTSRPDGDNILKLVSDSLNGLAYRDDSQIVKATVEKWYSLEPRVEIEIKEVG